jgi:hypothetical protein
LSGKSTADKGGIAMKKKYWLAGALALFFVVFPSVVFWFRSKPKEPPAVTAPSAAAKIVTPLPTLPIPANLRHPLTRLILQAVNVSLSQTEDTSQGDMNRKSGPALIELKQGLAALIEAEVQKPNPGGKGWAECQAKIQKEVQDSLDEAAKTFGVTAQNKAKSSFYEPVSAKDILLREVEGHPDLLMATTAAEVNCGTDESFYLFQKKGNAAQLALKQEDDDPKSTGQEGLDYAVSPADERGDFFVVLAFGRPWCTSCWGVLNYKVLRIGPDPEHPRVLLDESDFIYRCGGRSLQAGKDDFLLSFTGGQGLDANVMFRKCLRHYVVEGNQVGLAGPLGDFPEDFLDEWVKLPWDEAKAFCAWRDHADLKDWHEKLNVSKSPFSLGFVQPCPAPGWWVIALETDDKNLPSPLYFAISKAGGEFQLEEIRETREEWNCPGEATPLPHPVNMG